MIHLLVSDLIKTSFHQVWYLVQNTVAFSLMCMEIIILNMVILLDNLVISQIIFPKNAFYCFIDFKKDIKSFK